MKKKILFFLILVFVFLNMFLIACNGVSIPTESSDIVVKPTDDSSIKESAEDKNVFINEGVQDTNNELEESIHVHTYSVQWSKDDNYHWHDATCEHNTMISGKDEHQWDDGVVSIEASETSEGLKVFKCNICGAIKNELLPVLPHSHQYGDWKTSLMATCSTSGLIERSCACGDVETQETSALGHIDEIADGICDRCNIYLLDSFTYTRVNKESVVDSSGSYLLFGFYPQSEVKDKVLKAELNDKVELPTEDNSHNWISYHYYQNNDNALDFMWYIDLVWAEEAYRGVYFTSYRPEHPSDDGSKKNCRQYYNGYYTSKVYWFKYEPIKWRILYESNGEALLHCQMIIDSQEYYSTNTRNNYAESNIRKWLNEKFYNTAFSSIQKQLICLTTIDNSARSTNPDSNAKYYNDGKNTNVCADTQDTIFLLSEREVTKSGYGFSGEITRDSTKRKGETDYALSQGLFSDVCWWTRSPSGSKSYKVFVVSSFGGADWVSSVADTSNGVVPALWIKLQ